MVIDSGRTEEKRAERPAFDEFEEDFPREDGPEADTEAERTTGAIFRGRFAKARKAAGFTQTDLARRLGVSKSTVEKWEYGRREIGLGSLVRAAGILNVSTDYLLGLSDYDGHSQDVSLTDRAKAVLARAREKGDEHALLFESTFTRYLEQTAHLVALHDEIKKNGAMVTKTNVKGGKNIISNPAIKDYNSTAALVNDTAKILMKFIQKPLQDDAERDEFDMF